MMTIHEDKRQTNKQTHELCTKKKKNFLFNTLNMDEP